MIRLFDAYKRYYQQIAGLGTRCLTTNYGYDAARMRALVENGTPAKYHHVRVFMVFDGARLLAVIPFEPAAINKLLPICVWKTWIDELHVLGDPLIDDAYANQVADKFINWLTQKRIFFIFTDINSDYFDKLMPFQQLDPKPLYKQLWQHARAAIQTELSADEYFATALKAKRRSQLRKYQKNLEQAGKYELNIIDSLKQIPDEQIQTQWSGGFLHLENAGWKGRKATSMASNPEYSAYFKDCCAAWFKQKKLIAFDIKLDGKTIACASVRLDMRHGQYIAHCIKTAYCEQHASAAPGVLMTHKINSYLLDHYKVKLIDSCAMPDNSLVNSIMPQKLNYSGYLVAPLGQLNAILFRLVLWLETKRIVWRQRLKQKYNRLKQLKANK